VRGYVRLLRKERRPDVPNEYFVVAMPDGVFRIEDVEPRIFDLAAEVFEPGYFTEGRGARLGWLDRSVEVPEPSKTQSAVESPRPVDLGAIPVEIRGKLSVGDDAPGFCVSSLDGKPIRLEDFRGKVLVLHFWSTTCGPCRRSMPLFRDLRMAFGADPRFALVGLSLDPSAEAPSKYVEENGYTWPQGLLGSWTESRVAKDWGVWSIPSAFVIGPDGKIAAKGLPGGTLHKIVGELLAKR